MTSASHTPAADSGVGETTPGPHETLVRRFIAAIEQRDADAYAALFAEDAVAQHPLVPDPVRGREQIRASEQALYDAFSDVRVELRSLLSSQDSCAMEVVLRATNTGPLDIGDEQPVPATGRTVELPAVWCCEIADDGLIAAERDYFDTARSWPSSVWGRSGNRPAPRAGGGARTSGCASTPSNIDAPARTTRAARGRPS